MFNPLPRLFPVIFKPTDVFDMKYMYSDSGEHDEYDERHQ